ncbi:MAG: hypothetical protein ABR529_01970 [Actinomycetota bacterium]
MPYRYGIELDDVEGHMPFRYEDLSGREVTIRLEDGTEVRGHGYYRGGEDTRGEDTEGHAYKWNGIELEVDDTQANLLRAASDRGEPVYVRFPDGAEVKGHGYRLPPKEGETPEQVAEVKGHGFRLPPKEAEKPERAAEVSGHGGRWTEDAKEGDADKEEQEDAEGHAGRYYG